MLRLGVEVRLGVVVLCLGIVETSWKGSRVGSPRHRDLRLGGALRLGLHT